jgi:hypothetical protein
MSTELSAADLMRQAGMTAENYMINGKQDIDKIMGSGYVKAHPELLSAYMQAAALDFLATFLAKEIGGPLEMIAQHSRFLGTRENIGEL